MVDGSDIKDIEKKLSEIEVSDEHLKEYLEETKNCFINGHYRSSIILFWNIFMYFLYKKIEEYGLKDFAIIVKDKKISFEGRLNSFYDINQIKDSEVIRICSKIGFFDKNVKDALDILSKTRNACAHVTQPKLSMYKTLDFFDSLYHYIKLVNNLSYQKVLKSFIDEIKDMEQEEMIHELKTMEFNRLKTTIERIFDKIALISEYVEYERNKNLFDFILLSVENREKDEEITALFELILKKTLEGRITREWEFRDKIPDYIKFSAVKVFVLEKGYLDSLVKLFSESGSFAGANKNIEVLRLFWNNLTPEHINIIARSIISNGQIRLAYNLSTIQSLLSKRKTEISPEIRKELEDNRIII